MKTLNHKTEELISEELLRFMASFFAERQVLISPNIELPENQNGFTFRQVVGVRGMVVFGAKYPLSGRDLSIKDHLNVWESIKKTDPFGLVYKNDEGVIYRSKDDSISFIL